MNRIDLFRVKMILQHRDLAVLASIGGGWFVSRARCVPGGAA
jgi:hypothetical protein